MNMDEIVRESIAEVMGILGRVIVQVAAFLATLLAIAYAAPYLPQWLFWIPSH